MKLFTGSVSSPIGEVKFVESRTGVCALGFADGWERLERVLRRRFGDTAYTTVSANPTELALKAYFEGDMDALDQLALDSAGSDFQCLVWKALRKIEAGGTCSYGELARKLGRPTSQRAVANANARNPVSLITPCHRVIGAGGALTGYAFGIERKRWLLDHESYYSR